MEGGSLMIKIERFIEGGLEANGYIMYHNDKVDCFVIDPGYNPKRYIEFINSNGLNLTGILLTHYHYDHVGAVNGLKGEFGCKVFIHRADSDMYKGNADEYLDDGEELFLDDEKIEVLHTPGHTMGGICFFLPDSKVVFTGDTIFNIDIGRTDFADSDPYRMLDTMKDIVDKWTNDITIYPGHGDPATMKYVRQHNREFIDAINYTE